MSSNDDFDFELLEKPSTSEVVNYLSANDFRPRSQSHCISSLVFATSIPLLNVPNDKQRSNSSSNETKSRRRSFDGIDQLISKHSSLETEESRTKFATNQNHIVPQITVFEPQPVTHTV